MKILVTEAQISERVREMGREITAHYQNCELTVIALLNGALPFAADLIRNIDLPLIVDTLAVSSYHHDKRGAELEMRTRLKLSPQGKHILLVDEVLDSGATLKGIRQYLLEQGAADVQTAVMVSKDVPRAENGLQEATWTGIKLPNLYLVGYGLDSEELYRNLPYIGAVD